MFKLKFINGVGLRPVQPTQPVRPTTLPSPQPQPFIPQAFPSSPKRVDYQPLSSKVSFSGFAKEIPSATKKVFGGISDLIIGGVKKLATTLGEAAFTQTKEYKELLKRVENGQMTYEQIVEVAPSLNKSTMQIIGEAVEASLDIATMGTLKGIYGVSKAAVKLGTKIATKTLIKQGAKVGLKYGAGFGTALGMQEEDADTGAIISDAIQGAFIGAFAGGLLSPVISKFGVKLGKGGKTGKAVKETAKILDDVPAHVTPEQKPALQRLYDGIADFKPLTEQQKISQNIQLRTRVAGAEAVRSSARGVKGLKEIGEPLAGAYETVRFEPIKITPAEKDLISNVIIDSPLSTLDIKTAERGLAKITDPSAARLPGNDELEKLGMALGGDIEKILLDKRTRATKAIDMVQNILGIAKGSQASSDLSFTLRQGIVPIWSHPSSWWKGVVKQLQAVVSEGNYKKINQEIFDKEIYKKLKDFKSVQRLFTTMGGKIGKREEMFASQFAENMPGIFGKYVWNPVVGRVIKASNRAFSAARNVISMDILENLVRVSEARGENPYNSKKIIDGIVDLIGTATGRSPLPGKAQKFAEILNMVWYSPQFTMSRIKLFTNPIKYIKAAKTLRREAWRQLIATALGTTSVMGLAKVAGADVEFNPLSTDFGKAKFGNLRIDLTGGLGSYIRYLVQAVAGVRKDTDTGEIKDISVGYKHEDRSEFAKDVVRAGTVAKQFVRFKESPVLSLATSLYFGENAIGQKFSGKDVADTFIPLAAQDIEEVAKDKGFWTALGISPAAILGVGVQAYTRDDNKKQGKPIETSPFKAFQP